VEIDMTLSCTFSDQGDYVLVMVEGTCSKVEAVRLQKVVAQHCQQYGIERMLVDARQVLGKLNIVDWYDLWSFRNPLFLLGLKRFAVVYQSDVDRQFVENMALSGGFPLKTFIDLNQAEQWLTKQSD
jgi:hypothetical protein